MKFLKRKGAGFCPRCGNPIDLKNDAYCMRCGYQIKRAKGKKLGIIKMVIFLIIILAVVAALRYYQNKPIIPDFSFLRNLTGK